MHLVKKLGIIMGLSDKLKLVKEVGEEIITETELKNLLETKKHLSAYDGFEPSFGKAPIHFAIYRAINIKKLMKAGIRFKLLLADYFAFLNNKLGGDLKKIQKVGEYFLEVWKAAGVKTRKVKVYWTSDIVKSRAYWDIVLRIARLMSIKRALRATTIMGRIKGELQSAAQVFYPAMQVADIFHLGVDICQLGMDQRKANVLARELAPKLGFKKPVLVHHHILIGLRGLQKKKSIEARMIASKMSKTDPSSCIYVHDSFEEIKKKLDKAYCPIKRTEGNPLIEYCKYLIFSQFDKMRIERSDKFGGNIIVGSFNELVSMYEKGKLHPNDLKFNVALYLDDMVRPIRRYFERKRKAKKLYETVSKYVSTR